MLIACCNGKVFHCSTYLNFNDIYHDIEPMYFKLCKYFSNKNSKFIFILGPSLPCTELLFDSMSNSQNLELSDPENDNIHLNINVLPKNESTRVENPSNTHLFDPKININYILSKGHSVITGKFNTSPYTIPLFEIASLWKNYIESKIKNCKHIHKVLFDSQCYIQKTNFKKYFKKFPAIF